MNDNSIQSDGELTRRDRRARETRTKLIETALDLFSRQGVDSTSIKDIARAAGVAQGLLYHYFAGKDDLLWGVLESNIFTPAFQQPLSAGEGQTAEEVLQRIALQFNAFLEERQPLMRLIFRELQTNLRVRELWEAGIQRDAVGIVESFLRARIETGELRPHRVEVTAHLLMNGVVTLYLPGGGAMGGSGAAIREMAAILARGIQAEKSRGYA